MCNTGITGVVTINERAMRGGREALSGALYWRVSRCYIVKQPISGDWPIKREINLGPKVRAKDKRK